MSRPALLRAWRAAAVLLLAAPLLTAAYALDDPGRRLIVGLTAPLSGPGSDAGADLELGVRLGLAEANASGGVRGKQLQLAARDDGADPKRSVDNAQALSDAGAVSIIVGHHDASIDALLAWSATRDVPLVGLASGAETLREPPQKNVFNLRAGVREEAAAIVLHLDTVGISRIVTIAQEDALGRAATAGIQLELARLAMRPQLMLTLRPDPAEAAITRTVQAACAERPEAFVLALEPTRALQMIRALRSAGCAKQIYVMSESGSRIASPEIAGVIVSQVLPSPTSVALPLVADFKRQLAQLLPPRQPSYPILEGYLYARVLVEALRRCAEPARRCLIGALESAPLQIGGYHVQFSPNDRRGSRFVEMTFVTADGRFLR